MLTLTESSEKHAQIVPAGTDRDNQKLDCQKAADMARLQSVGAVHGL